jgi:L-fuculose-phosphate aldolase
MMTLGPVPVAPYGRAGTPALAESVAPLLAGHDAILLANHGALTLGKDGEAAYFQMERLEHTAAICLNVRRLGGGISLSPEEQAALAGHSSPAINTKE